MKQIEEYSRVYARIDLDAIRENIKKLAEKLKPETGIIGVIKTDGYGHGAVPIAKAIDDLCHGYAVATAWEGHNLRRHKINKPIYILGYVPDCSYDLVIEEEMLPPIFTYKMAKDFSDHAVKLNKIVNFNIAVDTGMSRIGYIPSEKAIDEIVEISKLPNIKIQSIFTHFAKADYEDKTSANRQYEEYMDFVARLEEKGVKIPIHHCANSAAMMEMPKTSLNVSRAGIAMYGLYPSEEMDKDNVKLTPAMSIYSHVVYVKDIETGRSVSYGETFTAKNNMTIATIPIGYGDGYPRNLSNKGYVLINGKKCNILGRICMDQFMVDVTGMNVKEGDKVVIVGKDGNEEILIDDLAVMAGTFNYEFICDLGKRVPRVFVKDNKIVGSKDYFDDDYVVEI